MAPYRLAMTTATQPNRKLSKSARERLRERVAHLRDEGLTIKEISEVTGVSPTVIGTLVPRRRRRPDAIDRDVLIDWLAPMTRLDGELGYTFNGRPLNVAGDKWHRSYYRLREEGTCWSFFTLDEFCVRILGVHISEFLDWAEAKELCIWANGVAPDWFDEEPDWVEINKTWPDPEAPKSLKRGQTRRKAETLELVPA